MKWPGFHVLQSYMKDFSDTIQTQIGAAKQRHELHGGQVGSLFERMIMNSMDYDCLRIKSLRCQSRQLRSPKAPHV